ncbi:MAG: response regulator [Luteolibacter sp.]
MNRKPLRILLVEDSEDDAFLVVDELRRQGYQTESIHVMTGPEFRSTLESEDFDVILCDYTMPDFDATDALGILRESGKDIPLIIVSGVVGEDQAVESMRLGAADYILKNNFTRLGPAVEREVREAKGRRQKRLMDRFSQSQSEILEMILNGIPQSLIVRSIVDRLEVISPDELVCAISLNDADGAFLECGAARGLPEECVTALGCVPIHNGLGTASAVALGDGVVEDISAHPDWESCRDLFLKHGLRTCWSVPIISSERLVLGKIAIYHRESRHPGAEELRWVESASKLVSLAIERCRDTERLRTNELRYLQQRNALIALTGMGPKDGADITGSFRKITETSAKTLGVSRVSIWQYSPDRTQIHCVDLYELGSDSHSAGVVLNAADYPSYFKALSEIELIVADDAHQNPHTSEFSENYLTPLGISSMIDAPIRFGNAVEYIICHEHVGRQRQWTADEKTFVIAIATLVSLTLEATERAHAENEVRNSHQLFKSVAAATNDTIWDWDLLTNAFWWNDGFARLFGWFASETQSTIHAWIRQIHPEDRDRVVTGIYTAIEGDRTYWVDEYRFLSNDGKISHVLDRGEIIRDETGLGIRMVGGMIDLTDKVAAQIELARSHRALQMLSSCNEMMIRATDEIALLSDVCALAVEEGGYQMAWVGYAMEDRDRTITPVAHAGDEARKLTKIETTWADDPVGGAGPLGQTIRSGEVMVCEYIADDPRFSQWLTAAREYGYQSVICLPLSNGQRTFGVIVLFARLSFEGGVDELKLLKQMAKDLSFGVQNIRVKAERQQTQEVVLKVAQAVSSGAGGGFFDLLTWNMVEALGADGGVVGQYDPLTNSIDTLSYVLDGRHQDNLTYGLDGTPCEDVAGGESCVFKSGVQKLFPLDHFLVENNIESYAGIPLFNQDEVVSGVMLVIFRKPLKETALVESTLKIFAARAASELDRQQADARIREQASLLDKAQDAIIVRDMANTITYWNKSAERLYGWTAREAIGRVVTELLYRDCAMFNQAFEHTLSNGEWVGELRHVNKDSKDLIIESRWTLVRDVMGNSQGFLVIDTDISDHRKLEQQFLRTQRLESIGTLAGGIAHDLNNILAPISMSIELLKMRMPDVRCAELLDTIGASAKRGTDMVGQVLSFARGMEGRRIEVHPLQLISEVEKILRDTFLKNIGLEVDTDCGLWTLMGDPTQLHQVLINLCVNARDAVSDHGAIAITAKNVEIDASFAAMNLEAKVGPHVLIEVKDDGAGIPPDIMDKIFDPFFTTKSIGKGTGLGLSTSLAIIKGHGGFIQISSELGVGTRFKIYLPAHPELADPAMIGPVDLPEGNGETVLIVDDEAFIRQITQETLETFGYRTLLASNGEEAISVYTLNSDDIDVVLTDMMMPVMNGAELIARLTQSDPAVRIIATSGISSNIDIAYTAGNGMKGFLPKPCTAEMLLKCLRELLSSEPRGRKKAKTRCD